MYDIYEVGVTVGMGLAVGVLIAGVLAGWRHGLVASTVGALGIGLVAGLLVHGWLDVPGGVIGGMLGAISASSVVRGAMRRGATLGATAMLLTGAAIVIAFVSIIPLVGFILAVVVPVVAYRRARSEPERFAGLRTLAK
jgi:hypothetical protein